MITSTSNPTIIELTKLHQSKYRQKEKQFLLVGQQYLEVAYQQQALKQIYTSDPFFSFYDVPVILCAQIVLDKLANVTSTTMVVGVCAIKEKAMPEHATRLLLLDEVSDPGNMGTIIRSALAFNFDGVIANRYCADYYNDKTVRASAGAIFNIALEKTSLIDRIVELKALGFTIIGTSLDKAIPVSKMPTFEKVALVLGNERAGVSSEVLEYCDMITKIEADAFESLNVAMAATILTYVYRK